ncbi:MAG: YkgJ family cysteine cluster protein [Alphaproteobacteria bacterium]|uniref:YkgJ family cysteine cluster protein n=1 Tax=Candidatus Nitrobium versatile TaxID=2884831 RepID=A0A953J8Y2_9BACT|nr:YkgJ family cysteine cluster protein [Candidatus Nitrobium versatile]
MNACLQRIEEIFRAIDTLYAAAQRSYGFSCEGCGDNCCSTKFHHHTFVEELYLAEGLKELDKERRRELLSRADEVARIHSASPDDVRVMCPLNEGGRCSVYGHRPLICRVHGIPYEMHGRDMSVEYGTGCHRFMSEKVKEGMKYFPFNRTMFYVEMARLEKAVRESGGFMGASYGKTTAEMVQSILRKT